MRQVLIRAAALLRNPRVVVFLLLQGGGGSGLVALPLFGLPGFELSLALSVGLGVLGGGVGLAAAFQERRLIQGKEPRPKGALRDDSALVSTLRAVGAAVVVCLAALVPPLAVSTGFALLSTECDPFSHLGFFPVLTLPTALLAAATGVCVGFASKTGWGGWLRYLAILLLSLVPTLWPLYAGPQVFAFNHFLGYFPGPLYDEALVLRAPVFLFRLQTLLAAAFVWLLTAFCLDMRDGFLRRPYLRPGAFALLGLVGFAFFVLEQRAPSLGLRMSDTGLAERLGGYRKTAHFDLHFPRGKAKLDVDRLERDLEYQYARTLAFLGTAPSERLRVWVYRTPEEKRALVGASRTQFAKPWRREIHLNDAAFPHSVLRHELVHAMASALAPGPFHVTARGFGLWPHMGIIEGVAVAAEDPAEELTLHEWAAGMRRQALAPDVREVLGVRGFYAQSPARAYTVAGSFLRHLVQQHGTQKLQALYAHGDFERVYGRPLDALATEWEAHVDGLPLDEVGVNQAFARFRKPSLFARPCAREVATLESEARELLRADPEQAQTLYARCAQLQPNEPQHALGQARALSELGRQDEAQALLASLREQFQDQPALVAQVRSEEATVAALRGALDEAKAHLEAILLLEPGPATERTARVKLAGLASPEAGPAIWAYFRDEPEETRLLRLHEALSRAPDEPSVPYLLGRRLAQEGAAPLALPYLAKALASPSLPEILRREARRLDIQAHYLAGDCAGVRHRVGSLPDEGAAYLQWAREWVGRCDFEQEAFDGPLVPADAFR